MFKPFQYPIFLLFNRKYKDGNYEPHAVPYISTAGFIAFYQWSSILLIALIIERILDIALLTFIIPETPEPHTGLHGLFLFLLKYVIWFFAFGCLYSINKYYFITKGLLDRFYQTFKDHPTDTRIKRFFWHGGLLLYPLLVLILLCSYYKCIIALVVFINLGNVVQLMNRPKKK